MNQPICRHLRTKKMFVPAQSEKVMRQIEDGTCSAFFWCNRTLRELGEDGEPVQPAVCKPDRTCHES